MLDPILENLADRVLVCDGAMGTQLYAKGVFLNRCFDELNIRQPALVLEVHQEYLWAGADILETNTFGANRAKLEPHGLADRVREINTAGVRLAREIAVDRAYVAGSVGPLGIRIEPLGKVPFAEARDTFAEQIGALAEAGADLISLETFFDLNELHAAIEAAREVCSLPVMAQITLSEEGNSLDGAPPEDFAVQLRQWGAHIVGVNCGVGPQVMLESVERISQVVDCPIVAQPNAGRPRNFEGRNLYLSSPEYMASYAKRFVRLGVRIVGGCCGTTPTHIRRIAETVASMTSVPQKAAVTVQTKSAPAVELVPEHRRSRLAHELFEQKFARLVGIVPPRGADPEEALRAARALKGRGIDGVVVNEGARGSASMGALALALLIQRDAGLEPVLHYTCADRTLVSMQAELLGAYALGLRNLFLSTGEPLRVGDYLDATAVYDVDTTGAVHLVAALNAARDLGGKAFGRPTGFFIGVEVNPGVRDLHEEIRRLERKLEAGAQYAVTTPVFRPHPVEQFVRQARDLGMPLIAALRPVLSYREAEFLNNEIPEVSIPDTTMARLRNAGSPERELQEGLAIAHELAACISPMVQGLEVSIPGADYTLALDILGL